MAQVQKYLVLSLLHCTDLFISLLFIAVAVCYCCPCLVYSPNKSLLLQHWFVGGCGVAGSIVVVWNQGTYAFYWLTFLSCVLTSSALHMAESVLGNSGKSENTNLYQPFSSRVSCNLRVTLEVARTSWAGAKLCPIWWYLNSLGSASLGRANSKETMVFLASCKSAILNTTVRGTFSTLGTNVRGQLDLGGLSWYLKIISMVLMGKKFEEDWSIQ